MKQCKEIFLTNTEVTAGDAKPHYKQLNFKHMSYMGQWARQTPMRCLVLPLAKAGSPGQVLSVFAPAGFGVPLLSFLKVCCNMTAMHTEKLKRFILLQALVRQIVLHKLLTFSVSLFPSLRYGYNIYILYATEVQKQMDQKFLNTSYLSILKLLPFSPIKC